MLGSDIVDNSVTDGDISLDLKADTIRQKICDDFISDASVTVILLGRSTWQRQHIDWQTEAACETKRKMQVAACYELYCQTTMTSAKITIRRT